MAFETICIDVAHVEPTCSHPGCVAYERLLRNGAKLMREVTGRRCEIAMLAAAGPAGLSDPEIVAARRHFAIHLGEPLRREPIKDPEFAIHADNAAQGPNGPDHLNRNPKNKKWIDLRLSRIEKKKGRLGSANCSSSDHYVLTFGPDP